MSERNGGHDIGYVWTFGRRSKYAHAFPVIDGVRSEVGLCGVTCKPSKPLHNWDPSCEDMRELSCPVCLARIKILEHMYPDSEDSEPMTDTLKKP